MIVFMTLGLTASSRAKDLATFVDQNGQSQLKTAFNWFNGKISQVAKFSLRVCKINTRGQKCVGWSFNYSMSTLWKKQMEDSNIGPILNWKESGQRPFGASACESSPATRHYWNLWDSLIIKDGVLFRNFHLKDNSGSHQQFLVPQTMRSEIMQEMHKSLLSGHLGKKKTPEKTWQRFYWCGIWEEVSNWVAKCHSCGAIKLLGKTPKAPLGSMPIDGPMDRLSIDIMSPLPESDKGSEINTYIEC